MKYSRSGQYELLKISITTNTRNPVVLNMMTAFIDATIYESIFDETMSGNVSLADTNNLIQKYGLGNGETIEIEWASAGVDNANIVCTGVVYDLTPPMRVNDHASAFTLHFTSPEMIASMRQKTFTGHRDSCSGIVKSLFERIKRSSLSKQKEINITSTRNIEHIVYTGQNTLSAIQMATDRAVSNSNKTGYMFYENNKEFMFTPIEDLYSQEPVIEYVYRSSAAFNDVDNAHEESSNVFQEFEIEPSNKYADDIMDGQYGCSTAYLSLKEKSFNVINYNADSEFDRSKSLGKNAFVLSSSFNDKYSDKLNIAYSLEHEPNELPKVQNKMRLLKLNTFAVSIGVFGLSTVKVGDVCKAKIPSFSSEDTTQKEVDYISGNFLIAEIKHILTPKIYNQRIKLLKDSFEEAIS